MGIVGVSRKVEIRQHLNFVLWHPNMSSQSSKRKSSNEIVLECAREREREKEREKERKKEREKEGENHFPTGFDIWCVHLF